MYSLNSNLDNKHTSINTSLLSTFIIIILLTAVGSFLLGRHFSIKKESVLYSLSPTPKPSTIPTPSVDCNKNSIYTNKNLEFTITVPSCYKIADPHPEYGKDSWVYFDIPDSLYKISAPTILKFSSYNFDSSKTFEQNADYWNQYYTSSNSQFGDLSPIIKDKKTIKIGGLQGIQFTIFLNSTQKTYLRILLPWDNTHLREILVNTSLLPNPDDILKTVSFPNSITAVPAKP